MSDRTKFSEDFCEPVLDGNLYKYIDDEILKLTFNNIVKSRSKSLKTALSRIPFMNKNDTKNINSDAQIARKNGTPYILVHLSEFTPTDPSGKHLYLPKINPESLEYSKFTDKLIRRVKGAESVQIYQNGKVVRINLKSKKYGLFG